MSLKVDQGAFDWVITKVKDQILQDKELLIARLLRDGYTEESEEYKNTIARFEEGNIFKKD